jgi:hypothetical protein
MFYKSEVKAAVRALDAAPHAQPYTAGLKVRNDRRRRQYTTNKRHAPD